MNAEKKKIFLLFIIGGLAGIFGMYIYQNFISDQKPDVHAKNADKMQSADALSEENAVIDYVQKHKELPAYYITKKEARKRGWNANEGNLCEVLPGKVIGGDVFGNREKLLPQGTIYFEADVNYNCGNRNGDRIIFNKDGEVWLTKNHYKSFSKK